MMRPLRVLLAVFCLTEVKGFTRGALMWQPRGAVPVSARIPLLLRPAALGSLHMAVSGDTDTWVRPEPRGKRDIIFGTLVTASQPVAKEHDEGCNLVGGACLHAHPPSAGVPSHSFAHITDDNCIRMLCTSLALLPPPQPLH